MVFTAIKCEEMLSIDKCSEKKVIAQIRWIQMIVFEL